MGFLKNLFSGKYFRFHKSEKKKSDELDPYIFGCNPSAGSINQPGIERQDYPNLYPHSVETDARPLFQTGVAWSEGHLYQAEDHPLRTEKGTIDDYWVKYDSESPDPYRPSAWPDHELDTLGDFMNTSQFRENNEDGETKFYTKGESGSV